MTNRSYKIRKPNELTDSAQNLHSQLLWNSNWRSMMGRVLMADLLCSNPTALSCLFKTLIVLARALLGLFYLRSTYFLI